MTLSEQQAAPALQVRPRALWYLLVVVIWVASGVVFGTAIASFVRVIDHGVTAIEAGAPVPVTDSGLTVYSRTKPATHDCFLQDSQGQSTAMDGLTFDANATFNGVTVYAVASSPDGLAPGDYQVSCTGVRSQLYYGDKFPIGGLLVRFGISSVLGLIGLVLLIVLLVKRHTSKSRIRTQNLVDAQGQSVGWPPGWAGGQPQSPYGQQPPPPPPPQGQQYPPYGAQQPYPPYDAPAPSQPQQSYPPSPPYPPYDPQQAPPPPPPYDEDNNPPR